MSPYAESNGQREKVTFATNVPTIVALEFDPPSEPRPGKFGDQFMYWLADHKIMFVDPAVHDAIVRTGATEGAEVCITKRETREGNRRAIKWEVQRVEEEPTPAATRPAPRATAPAPAATAPAPIPASAPATSTNDDRAELARALTRSIDAAAHAEQYAREKGLAIRFTSEDVRTMANALMMRAERSGR